MIPISLLRGIADEITEAGGNFVGGGRRLSTIAFKAFLTCLTLVFDGAAHKIRKSFNHVLCFWSKRFPAEFRAPQANRSQAIDHKSMGQRNKVHHKWTLLGQVPRIQTFEFSSAVLG